MSAADAAVFDTIERDLLHPAVVDEALDLAVAELTSGTGQTNTHREDVQRELTKTDTELRRLSAAAAAGGELNALLGAIREPEQRTQELRRTLATLATRTRTATSGAAIVRDVKARLEDWRGLLAQDVLVARQVVQQLLTDHAVVTPTMKGGHVTCEMRATLTLGGLFERCLTPRAVSQSKDVVPHGNHGQLHFINHRRCR